MNHRADINNRLDDYVSENCSAVYAQINRKNEIHLDGYFNQDNLKDIMQIISEWWHWQEE